MFIVEGTDERGRTELLRRVIKCVRKRRWERHHPGCTAVFESTLTLETPRTILHAVGDYGMANGFALQNWITSTRIAMHNPVFEQEFTPHARRMIARELNTIGSVAVLLRSNESVDAESMHDAALTDYALGTEGLAWLADFPRLSVPDELRVAPDEEMLVDRWWLYVDRADTAQKISGGYGSPWPKFLFVMEGLTREGSVPTRSACPFFNLEEHTNSSVLSTILDHAGIGERELRVFELLNDSGGVLTDTALRYFAPRKIIALGRVAFTHLRKLGLDCVEFPHLQYLRRFEAGRLGAWGERLREAVRE